MQLFRVIIDVENQNALTSTAMLAAIWECEKKDTLELMLPFITYSIGRVTSVGNQVDIDLIAAYLTNSFGFTNMPHSVLYKAFKRLSKRNILTRKNGEVFLQGGLEEKCSAIDLQRNLAQTQTDTVIKALTEYLNQKKDHVFKNDMSIEDVKDCFVKFLNAKGYFVYIKIEKLQGISINESTLYYYIAQFILDEHNKKSDVFSYIDSIVKGLLLSRVIYGYVDTRYNERFRDMSIYLDTTLLLHVFGFKSNEENTAAAQLVKILHDNNVRMKCFSHNYLEIYKIIEAYKYSILDPSNRYGQTIEYFDQLGYSSTDVDRVLLNLEEYFKAKSIEIVDMPSLSSDGSGVITSVDFQNVVGEMELKDYLSKALSYRRDEALVNDVYSISAIFTLRRGKKFKKTEECKALFVTTTPQLVNATENFINDTTNSIPLLISDLELTTILWLKNNKKFADLPTLKLIEIARVSLEPTEQIRTEFIKKIEQFKNEPTVTNEIAANYRQLIYTEKGNIMNLINADPEKISNIKSDDLERISQQHYNSKLANENQSLKQDNDKMKRKLRIESNEKIEQAGKIVATILKSFVYVIFVVLLTVSIVGLYKQWKMSDYNFYSLILLGFSLIGIVDAIIPRFRFVNKLIMILANKRKSQIIKQEQERIAKILGD